MSISRECIADCLTRISPEYRQIIAQAKTATGTNMFGDAVRIINETNCTLSPSQDMILKSLENCPYKDLKIIIVGQDPYPDVKNACGMSFSVQPGVKVPASLRAIYRCLNASGIIAGIPSSGDLTPVAQQGVLWYNMALTTVAGTSNVHQNIWAPFSQEFIRNLVIRKAADGRAPIIMLWGQFAKKLKTNLKKVMPSENILEWGHPSPISTFNKKDDNPKNFLHCTNFSSANALLAARGETPINWAVLNDIDIDAISDAAFIGPGGGSYIGDDVKLLGDLIADNVFLAATDGGAINNGKPSCVSAFGCVVWPPGAAKEYFAAEFKVFNEDPTKYITATRNKISNAEFMNDIVNRARDAGAFTEAAVCPGKKQSNNVGECFGVNAAMKYAVAHVQPGSKMVCIGDSKITINCITGVWKAKENVDIIQNTRDLRQTLLDSTIEIDFCRIHSHWNAKDVPRDFCPKWVLWLTNEIADCLATDALRQ